VWRSHQLWVRGHRVRTEPARREGRVRVFLGGALRCLADSESPSQKENYGTSCASSTVYRSAALCGMTSQSCMSAQWSQSMSSQRDYSLLTPHRPYSRPDRFGVARRHAGFQYPDPSHWSQLDEFDIDQVT
jgi:hypothetical protein